MLNNEKKGTLGSQGHSLCWQWRYFHTKFSDSESSIYSMVRHDAHEFRKFIDETSSTTSSTASSKIELTSIILIFNVSGGESGIRTHDTIVRIHTFQAV